VLTVVVGEGDGKREFVVHEELICESSDFFRGAMSGEWKEAGDRVVSLPDDDPDVFALYLQAIYVRVLPAILTRHFALTYSCADR
jgi:hypothetical protein